MAFHLPVHVRCVTFDAGYPMARENARKLLEIGKVYTIQTMHVHQSSTSLEFWELRGTFSAVFFEPVDELGRPVLPLGIPVKSCCNCLWDIARDSKGRWRLAWGCDDDDDDPYACDESSQGHAPMPDDEDFSNESSPETGIDSN
jgi:hypothetical protein